MTTWRVNPLRWLLEEGVSRWEYDEYDPKRPLTRIEIVIGLACAVGFPTYMLLYFSAKLHIPLW